MYRRTIGLIVVGLVMMVALAACGDATNTAGSGAGAGAAGTSGNAGSMPGMTTKPGETMPAMTSNVTTAANAATAGQNMGGMTMTTGAASGNAQSDEMTASLKGLSSKEFEVKFMQYMIAHHQGAIDMAKLVPTNTKRPELIKLSQDIISAQTKEIGDQTGWLAGWYNEKPLTDSMSAPGMMSMMGDMGKLKQAKDAEFDKLFIAMMITHHQAAVNMANLVPGKTQRPELLKLGQDIVRTQSDELAQMKGWQKAWFNA